MYYPDKKYLDYIETMQELLENIGYEVDDLKYYETTEDFYDVTVHGNDYYCHNTADFYTGKSLSKVQKPTDENTTFYLQIYKCCGKILND